jgi:hypothetical protein
MRMNLLNIFAMAAATFGVAVFFVQSTDAPVHLGGPLLGKYAAAWRTAPSADQKYVSPAPPLNDVTIINATH